MSDFREFERNEMTRRAFIHGSAAAITGACLIDCEVAGQQSNVPISKALDDPGIIHGKVSFKSGSETIDGYLSRPKAKGRFPIVLVISGSTFMEEYIRYTTAMLAQVGFVGLSPNIYALQLDTMSLEEKRQVFRTQITDDRIFRDLRAGVEYLRSQLFTKSGPIGTTGFCFGGRCALMFATRSKEVGAIVPFYGNLKTPPEANRPTDPIDLPQRIKVPVQGHYAKNDEGIPLEQLKKFEEQLRAQGTPVEMFVYEAAHGFFAYTRSSYNAEVAALSWNRAIKFFKEHLK